MASSTKQNTNINSSELRLFSFDTDTDTDTATSCKATVEELYSAWLSDVVNSVTPATKILPEFRSANPGRVVTPATGVPPEFKLVIVGDGGTGKTSWLKTLFTGEFPLNCEPTMGLEVYQLDFPTNRGNIMRFICSDTPGHEKLGVLRDSYYKDADCAVIIFDVTCRLTYTNASDHYNDLSRVVQNIPIVLCGNKVDVTNRQVKAKQVTFHRKKNLQYCEMSAKTKYNIEEPLLYLARELSGDLHLRFVGAPTLVPQEAQIGLAAPLVPQEAQIGLAAPQASNFHTVEATRLAPQEVQIDLAEQQYEEQQVDATWSLEHRDCYSEHGYDGFAGFEHGDDGFARFPVEYTEECC